ncbi:MAG: DNA-3-methyladenine glycosylase [Methylophaga sp.]|nr:DNA-3-methyladenine glycosylase [Methylophaga sp.]
MNTLKNLLNQKVIDNPDQWFESVCNLLFYRTIFHIKDQRYKITEAELYLNSKEHPDVFTHGSADQEKVGLFYFHKHKLGKSYKELRNGVDITFGNENRFGGILLRGMQNIGKEKESDYIDGPALLSQRIMGIFKEKGNKVSDVVPKLDINIFNAQDLWLEEISGQDQDIYKAPRVGLALSKDVDSQLAYVAKLYRYLAAPLKTKKP